MKNFKGQNISAAAVFLILFLSSQSPAVTSRIIRHSTAENFQKGKTDNVIIGSQGTISLGKACKVLAADFNDVWTINCITSDSSGAIYAGTSPNGAIFKYSGNKLSGIYPPAGKTRDDISNQHIFAIGFDSAGNLLAGLSGKKCALIRFADNKGEIIFEPNDASYIFAIIKDKLGNIYLGTGPNGKIYRLNPSGKEATVIYDSQDKNILSLAADSEGYIYAGADQRGIVYKINPKTKIAGVVYDSDQPEITSLWFDEQNNLYAAASAAQLVQPQQAPTSSVQTAPSGRSESSATPKGQGEQDSVTLTVPNTTKPEPSQEKPALPVKGAPANMISAIHKITKEGFVTEVFRRPLVFFTLTQYQKTLLVGTGNNAELFGVNPDTGEHTVLYKDQQASQITAVLAVKNEIYAATSNPAKLLRLSDAFASEGSFISDIVDAGQPAKWGKLQLEADIPQNSKIFFSARSGNVNDINDSTFSTWTKEVEVSRPEEINCPVARFCQYKLIFRSPSGKVTPVVRAAVLAYAIPNFTPEVEAVSAERLAAKDKEGVFKITYQASDLNQDKLLYKIEFRKTGRPVWILLKDKVEADNFEWDGRTVEDGRYEVRVTASDELGNTPQTKLTAGRISDPIVIDNTPPAIENSSLKISDKKATLKLTVKDNLSVIAPLSYTIDSGTDWISAVPDDLVYDTTAESFTLISPDLSRGPHVIAVKICDDAGNTAYKTFELNIE